jgi:hypothetical protein
MRPELGLALALIAAVSAAALGACNRRSGLYADRSAPPPASSENRDAPWYVGRWARSPDQCADPWVFSAWRLDGRSVDCDFEKVEASQAGYAVSATCRSGGGLNPTRLSIVTPDQARVSTLTISGGPFTNAVALKRCAAQ